MFDKDKKRAQKYFDMVAEIADWHEGIFGTVERTPNPSLRSSPLHDLAEKYMPTKMKHDYIRHYWSHFRDARDSATRVVEIGVQTEKSIRMWEDFFPNATIYGIDIDPECAKFSGGRREIHIGDQMDTDFLKSFISETGGEFDIVIDDGLHSQKSILTSFAHLFPSLHARGIYVIEDIQRSPVVMSFINTLMEHINHYEGEKQDWPYKYAFLEKTEWITRHIGALAFYRYICFIQRGINPEENPYLIRREDA